MTKETKWYHKGKSLYEKATHKCGCTQTWRHPHTFRRDGGEHMVGCPICEGWWAGNLGAVEVASTTCSYHAEVDD